MSETMMNPETRRLIQVTMNNLDLADKMFEIFLGEKVEPRRDYIVKNYDKYSVN